MHKKHNTQKKQPLDKGAAKDLRIIGSKLYALRKARKESLKTVGEAIEMSPRLISKMEKGQHNFFLSHLFNLCHYYHVKLMDVMP